MNSADRAARLALVKDDEADRIRAEEHAIAAARRYGTWTWRFVGSEVHLRSRTLPTLRLDMMRSEAADLMRALSRALGETLPKQPRITAAQRKADKRARSTWNKANAAERTAAIRAMAEEFAATGGW